VTRVLSIALAFRVNHTGVETSDYRIQENCNSGSIGVYFRSCRDECLRRWADLDRLRDSGSDFDDWRVRRDFDDWRVRRDFDDWCVRRDFDDWCVRRDLDDWRVRRDFDDWRVRRDFDDWRVRRNFAGNLVLGHQFQ
jgi:hypothetical protein